MLGAWVDGLAGVVLEALAGDLGVAPATALAMGRTAALAGALGDALATARGLGGADAAALADLAATLPTAFKALAVAWLAVLLAADPAALVSFTATPDLAVGLGFRADSLAPAGVPTSPRVRPAVISLADLTASRARAWVMFLPASTAVCAEASLKALVAMA